MKKGIMIALLVCLVFILGACGPSSGGGQFQPKDTIVYHLAVPPRTLDPPWGNAYEWEVVINIYDSLFRAPRSDYDNNIIPWLLEEYSFSDDYLDLHGKLREGILFHNGDRLTTADVAFTVTSAKESPLIAPAISSISHVEIIDDYRFIIKQSRPFPHLLPMLASPMMAIKNKALYEQHGTHSRQAIIGTGPYRMVEWSADNNITLEYVEGYWGGVPEIKKVTFRPILDPNAATIAFESGELDVYNWPLAADQEHFIADERFSKTVFYRLVNSGISFNNQHPVFSRLNVRRAINHAIDKEALNLIAEGIGNTDVHVKSQANAEGHAQANITKYEYNPQKAIELLALEGYSAANPLRTTYIATSTAAAQMFASAVQDQLARVNVILDVQALETGAWMARLGTSDFEMSSAVWSFESWWASILYVFNFSTGMFYNYENISIPEVDQLARAGLVEMDPVRRAGYYARLLEIVSDQAICVPIMQSRAVCLSTRGLVLSPDLANMISPVFDMYWDPNYYLVYK